MLNDDWCYQTLWTAWYFFTLEIAFKRGKEANIFFALKKSEQAETVAFNLVNYNIPFLFYWRRPENTC